ncbi:hypothetical protein [Amycolatopsis magusensis]|uniref:hypothetical protein n=1 Tax=Amycolatopsis magusensis TaxID=882444 RepID=UPI0037B1B3C7
MASLDDYLPAALADLGRLTILVAPIEHYETAYDPSTHVLRIDPSVEDKRRAIADALVTIVDGQEERALVSLAGGGDAAACEWLPAQRADETAGRVLRLVDPKTGS